MPKTARSGVYVGEDPKLLLVASLHPGILQFLLER
jgi:hypothetical protein